MAIEKVVNDVKLVAKLNTGVDEEGNMIVKSKTLSNVSLSASEQAKFDVVEAIASLQDNQLVEIENREYARLVKGL